MTERENIEQAIATLEIQRAILGDDVVAAAVAGLRQRLADLGNAGSVTQHAAMGMSGERKLVTVMFADLSGFTALSETLDPEQVRSLMNACFNCLVPVIAKYDGTVDKFIGDEIMALFGAPAAHENDAERALRAALEMMEALAAFNARYGASLAMHIGVNTGLVVAGGLGSDGRQQYSVMGDTVNLAARLKEASSTAQILVGPNTYRRTAPLFRFGTLAPIVVKGKAGLVAVHELLGSKAVPGATRGIAGLHSPLVGRDTEAQRLQQTVDRLSGGQGGILAVTGEPGLGKSRLVAEVRLASAARARWAESRAQSYTQGMSYWMVKNLIDDLLGIAPDTAPADVAAALRSSVEALFADRETLVRVHPYLARLRDTPLDADAEELIKDVRPEALQNRMRGAFAELMRALCRLQPIVLVWEDLHWADPSSLGLLEALLPLTTEAPLLLLLAFRAHEGNAREWYQRVTARYASVAASIELGPLTDADSLRLVENLLKIENLPVATRQLILSKAEGNPFFLEELLRSLIDAGMVLVEGDRAVVTGAVERLQIPDTLQDVIAARIDRLPPGDKHTLQTAAVIGRVFQRPVLAYVLERERASECLDDCLDDLQRRELIRHRLELEYIFKHAVTQDVTYDSLLMAKRKELHLVTAEAIESLFRDQLEELAPAIAYHYVRAESTAKAIHYLTRAADHDRETYSNVEAIVFYRAALEQAGSDERWTRQTVELHEKLGDVLKLSGEHDRAREAYQAALAKSAPSDRVRQSRLRRKEGNTWMPVREFAKALHAFELAETALGPEPDIADADCQHEWLETQLDRIHAHYWAHQVAEMASLVDRIRPVIEEHGAPGQRSKFFRSVVLMAWRRDRFVVSDETLSFVKAAVAAARESGDLYELTFSTLELGMSHVWRREPDRAEVNLQRSLALAERMGDAEMQVLSQTYLTVTSRLRHEVVPTRARAERCEELAAAARMPFYNGSARANLAWAAWAEGNLTEARADAEAALEIWGAIPVPNPGKWLALWPLAAVDVAQGKDEQAIARFRELIAPPAMRMPQRLESLLMDTIEAWEAGDADNVRALLPQCVALAQQTGWL